MAEDDSTAADQREFFEDYRRQADFIQRIAERRGGLVVSGAGGAIFLTITFLDSIATPPFGWTKWLLFGAWAMFLVALGSALRALYSTEKAHRVMLDRFVAEHFDVEPEEDEGTIADLDRWTRGLNEASYGALVLGALLFTAFAAFNLPSQEASNAGRQGQQVTTETDYRTQETPRKGQAGTEEKGSRDDQAASQEAPEED